MAIKKYEEKTPKGREYKVFYKSCRKMSEVKGESVMLIFTSPPYFNLKDYSTKPKRQKGQLPSSPKNWHQSYEEYLKEMNHIWKECVRVLSNKGTLIINTDVIKFKTKDKNIIPIPFDFLNQLSALGLGCKDILIYKKLTGVPFQLGKKLKNRHEYLLIFSKTNDYKWNLDEVREPYPENYLYPVGHKRRNDIGQAPSSVWEYHPPFQSGGKNHYHYCPFPDGMVDRAIKLFTDEGDLVLDPFLGSGKVVSRAKVLGRDGIGYEINTHFKEIIEKMIKETKETKAKV